MSRILIPILSDPKKHWVKNRLSFVYEFNLETNLETFTNFNHNDLEISPTIDFLVNDDYIYHKKYLSPYNQDLRGYEAELVYWFQFNQRLDVEENKFIRSYWNQFQGFENLNDAIPIVHWLDYCKEIKDIIIFSLEDFKISEPFLKYQEMIDNLTIIEKNGLFTKR